MKLWFKTALSLALALTAVSTAAQQATKYDQAPDGIKLHGNWVLDIRNPDGALVGHSEFKNALVPSGQAAIAELLSTREAFYDWLVAFNEDDLPFPHDAITPLCGTGLCFVAKAGGPWASASANSSFQSVTSRTLSIASLGGKIVLKGTFVVTAAGGGRIQSVVTHLPRFSGPPPMLTVAILPTPVPVAQGQIVQFTYTLSFS